MSLRVALALVFALGFFGGLNDSQIAASKTTNAPSEKAPRKVLETNEKFASHPFGTPLPESCLPAGRTNMPCLPFDQIQKMMSAEPDPPSSNESKI
jgi:hypothetical protein